MAQGASLWSILLVVSIPIILGMLIYFVDKWYHKESKPGKKRRRKA